MRLPWEVAPLFQEWLAAHFPDRAERVMNHIQAMRGGRDNEPKFFKRFQPQGAYAATVLSRYRAAAARHGLDRGRLDLRCDLFRPPAAAQGELF